MALSSDEKLRNFAGEAINDAKQISEEMERQTKHDFNEKIRDGKKQILTRMQNYVQQETEKIKKEKSLEISQANVKTRQDYFKYTDTISSQVSQSVHSELRKFMESSGKSGGYELYLFQSCKNIMENSGNKISVFYSPKDESVTTVNVKNKLEEIFDISRIEFVKDETIKTGGLRFYDHVKNILINDAFEEKAERAKELLNSIIGPQFSSVK